MLLLASTITEQHTWNKLLFCCTAVVLNLAEVTNFHSSITGDPGLVTDLQWFKLLVHNWRLNLRHLFLSEANYYLSLVSGKTNTHTHEVRRQMNSHRINRVWACLYTSTLCLPQGRRTHTNNYCGIGSVVNSQLLLITQHKLTQLPTRSGQLRCNTTPVCKLHQQTVGVHGAAVVRGLDPQMDGFTHNRNHVQSSPTALSGSPTWSPADDLFLERGRDFLLANWRETHFQASRAAHLAYNLIIDEEGREQMQLLRSFNVNKIKCF